MRLLFYLFFATLPFATMAQSPLPFADPDFKKAEDAFLNERYEDAISLFKQIERTAAPTDTDRRAAAALRMARCQIDLGDYYAALRILRPWSAVSMNNILIHSDLLLEQGFAYYLSGHADSTLLYSREAVQVLKKNPDPGRSFRAHLYAGMAEVTLWHEPEALTQLRAADALYHQYPDQVTAYDAARLYTFLAFRYSSLGWEKSRKSTLEQLDQALRQIPRQEIRWGHIILVGHGLYPFEKGDSLTRRLEQVYTRRLGMGSIGRAYALQTRATYARDDIERLKYFEQSAETIRQRLGDQSVVWIDCMASCIWPLYALNQQDSALHLNQKVWEWYQRNHLMNPGRRAVFLGNASALYRFKGEMDKAQRYTDSLQQFIIGEFGTNSMGYLYHGYQDINEKYQQSRYLETLDRLEDLRNTIVAIAGDSSTILLNIDGYYRKKVNCLNKLPNRTAEALSNALKADSLVQEAYGNENIGRAYWLNQTGAIYFNAGRYGEGLPWFNEEERILLLNRKDTDAWHTSYRYNIGYRFLTATVQGHLDEANQLLAQFEQAESPSDPDHVSHLLWTADLAKMVNNQDLYHKYLQAARRRFEQDLQHSQPRIFTQIQIFIGLFDYYLERGKCDSAQYYLELARPLAIQNSGENDPDRVRSYLYRDIQIAECRQSPPDILLELNEQYKRLLQTQQKEYNATYIYDNIISILENAGSYERAAPYRERKLQILKDISLANPQNRDFQMTWLNAEAQYSQDSAEQIRHLQAALDTARVAHLSLWGNYLRLGAFHVNKNQYEQGLLWYLEALKTAGSEPLNTTDSITLAFATANTAWCYRQLGQVDSANIYAAQALDFLEKVSFPATDYADLCNRMFWWFRDNGHFSAAVALAEKCMVLLNVQPQTGMPMNQIFLQNTVVQDLYSRAGINYRRWFQDGIHRQWPMDPLNNEQSTAITGVPFSIEMLEKDSLLRLIDSAIYYNTYTVDLQETKELFNVRFDQYSNQNIRDEYTRYYYLESARSFLYKYSLTNDPQWKRAAFRVSEQWRGAGLRQLIQARQAEGHAEGESAQLVATENHLNHRINQLQGLVFQSQQAGQGAATYTSVEQELERIYQERKVVLATLEKQDPAFYRSRFTNYTASPDRIQRLLPAGQTMLEYFYSDSILLTFVIRPDTFIVRAIPTPRYLNQWIQDVRWQAANAQPDRNVLYPAAWHLYQALLEPLKAWLTDDLLIIPDGQLATLPFAALLTSDPQDSDTPPWLLQQYRISYAQSATIWEEVVQRPVPKRKKYRYDFVGFAPSYAGLDDQPSVRYWSDEPYREQTRGGFFGPLKKNRVELEDILSILGADARKRALKGTDARRDSFDFYAPTARFIHFSGHAKAYTNRGEYSFLVWAYPSDSIERLRYFAKDIYRLHLPAELVVLSGCGTGDGAVQSGEGVIGLGRAFLVAGSRSLVLTLWSVDDASTAVLMKSFYQQLRTGIPKNEALRRAQLALSSQGYAPFYWAPFQQYGDSGAIKF